MSGDGFDEVWGRLMEKLAGRIAESWEMDEL